jgi:DeoR/GlpR family transcriptional regulator of sugar metabolism
MHDTRSDPCSVLFSLEEGPNGFEGGMSATKYMTITGASNATATRDLQALVEKGIFLFDSGGSNTPSLNKFTEKRHASLHQSLSSRQRLC